jgi:hypothetical protein
MANDGVNGGGIIIGVLFGSILIVSYFVLDL